MTSTAELSYAQWVVIAENELKLDNILATGHNLSVQQVTLTTLVNSGRRIRYSMKIGQFECNMVYDEEKKKIDVSCQNISERTLDEVHMELVGYVRNKSRESFQMKPPMRHIFTPSANTFSYNLGGRDNVITVRILKDRPMFPDFTLQSAVVGRARADGRLRVCDQVFHVNKHLLAMHCEYFDRMYNGPYVEANKEEVELKHEGADAAVFHDFLLVMCVTEALPNPKNVAALSKLANIYQADNVREKCQWHLSMCREMPVEERYVLALENGNKELQTSIMHNVANLEEAKRIVAALSKNA